MTGNCIMIVFTGVIAAMAIAQVIIFHRQWVAMNDQLSTMNSQLKEMQTTSEQLDKLVKQATNNAIASEGAAKAALLNAQAVINAQRAWVMLEVQWHGTGRIVESMVNGVPYMGIEVVVSYENKGKTPAWIIGTHIRLEIATDATLSEIPNLPTIRDSLLAVVPLGAGEIHKETVNKGVQAEFFRQIDDRILFLYGVVAYKDIFDTWRETFFGYSVCRDAGRLSLGKIFDAPAYNKNT